MYFYLNFPFYVQENLFKLLHFIKMLSCKINTPHGAISIVKVLHIGRLFHTLNVTTQEPISKNFQDGVLCSGAQKSIEFKLYLLA